MEEYFKNICEKSFPNCEFVSVEPIKIGCGNGDITLHYNIVLKEKIDISHIDINFVIGERESTIN